MPKAQGRITIRRRPKDGDPGTPGADSVRYWIQASTSSVAMTEPEAGDAIPVPSGIAVVVRKQVGNQTPIDVNITTEGLSLDYMFTRNGKTENPTNFTNGYSINVPTNTEFNNVIIRLFKGTVMLDTITIPFIHDGETGKDGISYSIILSPGSISVNADGSFVCSADKITAKAYKNVGGVTSDATGGTMRLIYAKLDGSVADVAASGIMATAAAGYASVTFEYRVNDKAVASAALAINREGQPGADAERYWLVPSATSIIKDKKGQFTPAGISFEVMYQKGAAEPVAVSDMFVRFRFTFSNGLVMQWQKYEFNTSIIAASLIRVLEVELYKSGNVTSDVAQGVGAIVDRVSIPIVFDGSDGDQGKQGLQGCIYRRSKYATGFEFHNDSELETAGLRYIDLVYIMQDSSMFASRAKWFRCKKTHNSNADNAPQLTSNGTEAWLEYWEPLNTMEPIYTPLLLADDAIITLMQSNQILITNDDGVVTAGFSGSNSGKKIRIWAGSQLPDDAPFRVDVFGALFSSNANITGKITATSGKIAGFNISGNSLTNGPEFDNDACIVFRNDTHHTFAGIGGNVLPATTAMRAVARFENEDSNDFWGLGRNIAMLLSAKNADINHAFLGSGNGNLDGWIGGYKYSTYLINGSNTLFSGYLKLRENNKWIVYSASTNSGVVLPSLSEVQTALGISDSTKFCVEFTILADLLSQYNFKVYGRTKLEITTNGVKTQPYFTGEYPVITHWNGGRYDSVEMGAGDSLTVLLIYDSSKGGVLDTDFQLKYTARIINQQS